jgi:hypothetical protein
MAVPTSHEAATHRGTSFASSVTPYSTPQTTLEATVTKIEEQVCVSMDSSLSDFPPLTTVMRRGQSIVRLQVKHNQQLDQHGHQVGAPEVTYLQYTPDNLRELAKQT